MDARMQRCPPRRSSLVALTCVATAMVAVLLAPVALAGVWLVPAGISAATRTGATAGHPRKRPKGACVTKARARTKVPASAKAARAATGRRRRVHPKRCQKPRSHAPGHAKARRHASDPAGMQGTRGTIDLTAGPVNLTVAELEDIEILNGERMEMEVAPLQTSPELQAIAEQRAREMAEKGADYAGHDVTVDLTAASLCSRAVREVSTVAVSRDERERERERHEKAEDEEEGEEGEAPPATTASVHPTGPIARSALSEAEEVLLVPKIRTDPTYTLIGDAIVETETSAYYVEDLAAPC
jgi:uncharacterized protein YkwD